MYWHCPQQEELGQPVVEEARQLSYGHLTQPHSFQARESTNLPTW